MRTFREFIKICEGSEIAGKLSDLAYSKADKLRAPNRNFDPYRNKREILLRIADNALAREKDYPEDINHPIRSRGGSGSTMDPDRDRGDKDTRLYNWANGRRDSPYMTDKERVYRNQYNRNFRGIKPRSGMSSSLPNVGRGVQQRPSGTGFTPGTGGNFGISGIGLAN
jgi:hypothetical protein